MVRNVRHLQKTSIPGNMKIQTTWRQFLTKSSKSLSNSTFSIPFWTLSLRSTVKHAFFKLYWIFFSDNLYVHVLLPLSPKKSIYLFDQSVQIPEQELATSWGVSWSCQEYSQMLEHNPFLDNMESDMLWLLFILHCQCLLPALQSSVFFTYGPLVYMHGLETNSAVYQSCVVYKPKERVNKGLNCLKQWMCPDEFGVIQVVFLFLPIMKFRTVCEL